jgi:hypothetical protein
VSVLGAVSLIVSGWAPPAAARSASSGRRIIPAGQLGGRFTASSVKSAEKVLALSGIATVAKESSTKALVTVHGPVRMRFTEAQVRSLALGAADGGGLTGSSLDSATPLPSGYPPFSYLLASWVSRSKEGVGISV